jgi:hypothetical protein
VTGSSCRRLSLLVTTICVALAADVLASEGSLVVGTVTIRRLDVFTEEESQRLAYQIANALHIETRESVIRNLLLFREGDVLDPEQLAQTERNLRALPFLRMASVRGSSPHDGVVDVEVLVQDAWSAEPGLMFGSKGGTSRLGFDLTDTNFLGSGREVALIYDSDGDRERRAFRFRDPSFFAPYWEATLLYSDNSDGSEQRIRIERPFFAVDTPWAFRFDARSVEENVKRYGGGVVTDELRESRARVEGAFGRAFSFDSVTASRFSVGIDFQSEALDSLAGEAVDEREYRYLFGEYEYLRNRWVKTEYVNRDSRIEDFNLGLSARVRLGLSGRSLGADRTSGFASFDVERGWGLGAETFALATASFQSRLGTEDRNTIVRGEGRLIHRYQTALPQTFIARAEFVRGWELDPEVQFFADGMNGLRGYRAHAFEGNKRFVVNLEQRLFLGREIFHFISPGAALFIDAGNATPDGRPLELAKARLDAGLGLRFGLSRSPRNVIRVDLAWPFNSDPTGHEGLLISVSSSQAF